MLAAGLVLVACADDGATPAAPNGLSARVQSLDNTFRPEVLEITAGTEVVWTNDGRNDHDVIASDGADWGVVADLFEPGDEYRYVFTLPGEYPYFCSIHGTAEVGMIGTVIVTD
jgi:plastocyanin